METYPFADHYPFKEKDLKKLQQQAKKHHAILVTTEKDYVRIPYKYQNISTICRLQLNGKNLFFLINC